MAEATRIEITPDEELVEEIRKIEPYREIIEPKERDFVEEYDLVQEIKNREVGIDGQRNEPMAFRASSIGYCIRMQYFTYMLQPLDDDDSDFDFKTGAADRGNVIHDMMKRKIMKSGLWRGEEVFISDRKLQFSGHIDAIIEWHGELSVVEIKSMNYWKYSPYLRRPDEHHIMQLQSYLWLQKLKTGYLLPYNKNNDKWTLLKTQRNDAIIKVITNKLKLLRYYTSHSILPERPFKTPNESNNCKWCRYDIKCWRGD